VLTPSYTVTPAEWRGGERGKKGGGGKRKRPMHTIGFYVPFLQMLDLAGPAGRVRSGKKGEKKGGGREKKKETLRLSMIPFSITLVFSADQSSHPYAGKKGAIFCTVVITLASSFLLYVCPSAKTGEMEEGREEREKKRGTSSGITSLL